MNTELLNYYEENGETEVMCLIHIEAASKTIRLGEPFAVKEISFAMFQELCKSGTLFKYFRPKKTK